MNITDTHPHVLSRLDVEIAPQELLQQMKSSGPRPAIVKAAEKTLEKVKTIWQPQAVCRWFEFQQTGADTIGRIVNDSGSPCDFDFGHSIQFLKHAGHVLVSVYTAGQALEQESMNASAKGELLEAYLIDLIGLIVLDRAGQAIREIAETQAEKSGWGVSPFLSPGSVHGWDLEEQTTLCSLLPLDTIGVSIRNDAILSPFKTISCLIGVGPGYEAARVGSTCQVCSKNSDCQMKQDFITD